MFRIQDSPCEPRRQDHREIEKSIAEVCRRLQGLPKRLELAVKRGFNAIQRRRIC